VLQILLRPARCSARSDTDRKAAWDFRTFAVGNEEQFVDGYAWSRALRPNTEKM
jgi:hypothetical protein